MEQTIASVLTERRPSRLYSSSVLKAARQFWSCPGSGSATALADELRERPEILAVGVVDGAGRALGAVRRDGLFGLLSKPFGREILGKMPVREVMEDMPRYDAHEGLFAVAAEFLGDDPETAPEFCLLVDEDGRFEGVLSSRDLAGYLASMTRDDVELAGALQERLLAGNELSAGPGWRLGAYSRAARGVGGDFWFTRALGDGRIFMALCDVSGKGVAASLVVAMSWGMLRSFDLSLGLSALIKELNGALIASFHLEKYLTGFFAIFDPKSSMLEIADMGHSHALIFRGGKAKKPIFGQGNLPVGIEPELEPTIRRWRLDPSDLLLLYSDGVTEQENARGRELGEPRLASLATQALARGRRLEEALPEAFDAYRGRTPQQDDVSLLVLELEG